MSPRKKKSVDIVIPVFNEAGILAHTHARLRSAVDGLPFAFTFLYVDDGSSDGTDADLAALAKNDPRVRVISLSRNFGHQAALTAGLDASRGDAVVTLDADGRPRWSNDREMRTTQPARSVVQRIENLVFKLFPPSLY